MCIVLVKPSWNVVYTTKKQSIILLCADSILSFINSKGDHNNFFRHFLQLAHVELKFLYLSYLYLNIQLTYSSCYFLLANQHKTLYYYLIFYLLKTENYLNHSKTSFAFGIVFHHHCLFTIFVTLKLDRQAISVLI